MHAMPAFKKKERVRIRSAHTDPDTFGILTAACAEVPHGMRFSVP